MANPDFTRKFAEGGDKAVISSPDYDGGWDDIVGDQPPQKSEFNSIMNEQDNKSAYLDLRARQQWASTITYNQSELALGIDGKLYSSLVNTNLDNEPSVSPSEWEEFVNPLSFGVGGDCITVTNADALDKSGFYQISGAATGSPDGSNVWLISHLSFVGSVQGFQFASRVNADDVRYRYRSGSSWSSWLTFGASTGVTSTTVITVSGTYNPAAGVKALKFTAVGGGGGAGGTDGQGGSTEAMSSAGAGGGTAIKTTDQIESSYTIVIGAAGSGGAAGNNNGSNGGQTSISSTNVNLTANGGNGGFGMTATSGTAGAGGNNGGTASGGDVNIQGGGVPRVKVIDGDSVEVCVSGTSFLGGGKGHVRAGNGVDATVYGEGGGGNTSGVTNSNWSGGDGFQGVVIVEEFF